jgi:hypothetical protein
MPIPACRGRAEFEPVPIHDCGVYTVTDDRARERADKMELVAKLHRESVSQRGIARITGVSRPTIIRWLQKKGLCPMGTMILPTKTRPAIKIDEQWSSRQAQAVKLLGAQVVPTGIQPQISQTLVHLCVDLSSI